MTRALAHRGPDAEGYFFDEPLRVFLGHRRLSIIDIDGGAQPMSSADGALITSFNGEIYNHRELRRELEARGQRFRTDHSDTEVLLCGYAEWGEALVEKLDGMFAFALLDRPRQKLLLARDRFGEKPLFYHVSPDRLVFASELPSLRRHPAVASLGVNPRALQKFFAYSFLPGRLTPYCGVERLLPGTTVCCDLRSGIIAERRYWRFAIEPGDEPPGTCNDWAEEVAALLRAAVRSRLQSDVALGVFLSGGIDSSAVAAFARPETGPSGLSTFTISFSEKSFDESHYAAAMAQVLRSDHHVELCDSSSMQVMAPEILHRLGEPLGDPSLLPTFMLSRHAARHVKVALSGDGGDELFAGYDPFRALRLAERYQALVPRPVHRGLRLIAARLPPSDGNMSFDFKLTRALRGLSFAPAVWNPVWLAALAPDEIARIFDERLSLEDLYSEAIELWDAAKSPSPVDRTLEFYTNLYLPDDILVKSDRAGMMNSLEVRAPFLARDLVEYVRRLPHQAKYRANTTKWILKRALQRHLPPAIVDRPKKGFGIPVSKWVRHLEQSGSKALAGLNDAPFREWATAHRARRRDYRGALWCRFVLAQMPW